MADMHKKCNSCGGESFVEAMDFINLRPVDKKIAIGSEKVYTVCTSCGEVVSIRVKNVDKLKR
jgi:predicted RNA-binding Zn-ribbon protein involved in translation (DUF1610 family)